MAGREGLRFLRAVLTASGEVDPAAWNAFVRAHQDVAWCSGCGIGAPGDEITVSRARGHVVRHASAECVRCGKAAARLIPVRPAPVP